MCLNEADSIMAFIRRKDKLFYRFCKNHSFLRAFYGSPVKFHVSQGASSHGFSASEDAEEEISRTSSGVKAICQALGSIGKALFRKRMNCSRLQYRI